jgi:predicted RNase H-like nuclease (RuvC/YqgF family)
MFISKVEKLKLISSMMDLMATVQKLDNEVIYLKGKIKALEGAKKPAKKPMSEAQRIKQREYAKRYKARKLQEKQNATSISTTSI